MRCIVTGGAGFIGSNLVDRLVTDGHEVIIFDNLSTGKKENLNPKAKFFKVDISDKNVFVKRRPLDFNQSYSMEDVMTGVDVVFHLAAKARVQPSIDEPVDFHNTNVNGTLNMLDACRRYDIKRFIFSSSSSVYGDVREEDLPTSEDKELNPMSPYAKQLLNGEPMTINGDGEQVRDFTYVGDVVEANVKLGVMGNNHPQLFDGEVFNIGNGEGYSVNRVAELLGGDKIHNPPVIEPKITKADNSKARKYLDWKPTQDFEKWVVKWKTKLGL